MTDFQEFWETYPRKVGKLAAQPAFVKARRTVSQDQLMAAVDRYIRHKPEYADWCHPVTWLRQGRWMDEYETPRSAWQPTPFECPHTEPKCTARWPCHTRTVLENARETGKR